MDYVYLWADGIHVNIRLEEHKLCLLVHDRGPRRRPQGTHRARRRVPGVGGVWADLLRDCARRGMRAPVLAIGDGALGFWGALREVFPQTREQRCWFHKIANVLAALPKSAHPGAKKALAEIWGAEDKEHALDAVKAFEAAYGAKFPKAAAKITDDLASCWRSTTTRPSTGSTCGPRTPSNVRSPRSGTGPRSPRGRLPGRRAGHGVQAHRVRPGPLARGQRTPPRRPGPRRRPSPAASSSNDPARKPPKRSSSTGLDYCSASSPPNPK